MLTQRQITLLRESFDCLASRTDAIFGSFFEKLFDTTPEARYLFPTDLSRHERRLVYTIRFIVSRLDRWNEVEPYLLNLGVRHTVYGVREADYAVFVSVLSDTLATVLPEGSEEVIQAWVCLFEQVSASMIDASRAEYANS